jgi:hypothetical protein
MDQSEITNPWPKGTIAHPNKLKTKVTTGAR